MSKPITAKVWFIRYKDWRNIGLTHNKRLWFFRANKAGSMIYKTWVLGILGLNFMFGVRR